MGTFRPALIGRWFFLGLFGLLGVAAVAVLVLVIGGDEGLSLPFVGVLVLRARLERLLVVVPSRVQP